MHQKRLFLIDAERLVTVVDQAFYFGCLMPSQVSLSAKRLAAIMAGNWLPFNT
jgi:hypothetical protein